MNFNIEHTFSETDRFCIGVDFCIMKDGAEVSQEIKDYFNKMYLEIAKEEVQGEIESEIRGGKRFVNDSGSVEFKKNMEYFLPGREDLLEEEFQFRADWQLLKNLSSLKQDAWDLTYSDLIDCEKSVSGKADVSVTGYDEETENPEDNEQGAFDDVIDSIHDEIERGETSGSKDIEIYGVSYRIDWEAE